MKCTRNIDKIHRFLHTLLACTVFLFIVDCAYGQNRSEEVTVSFRNIPLSEAIERIQDASSYTFFYDANTLDLTTKVSLNARSMKIWDAMRTMLEGTGIMYELSSWQIILLPPSFMENFGGEEITITGVVTDRENGLPMAGVAVNVKGTNTFALSDINGRYSISGFTEGSLLFSFLGMEKLEEPVRGRKTVNVSMKPDAVNVQEIIVTGYQTISSDRVTGSYGIISAADLGNKPIASLTNALEGKVSGLTIDNNGQLEVRGISTFNAGRSPLIVVDGFPVESSVHDSDLFRYRDGVLEGINPDNVESITVLKDAVAASIYGSRAANGVVVVVTKKGRQGQTNVLYKGTLSVKTQPKTKDLLLADVNDIIDAERIIYDELSGGMSHPMFNPFVTAGYYWWMADNGFMSTADADAAVNKLRSNDFLKDVDKYLFRPEISHQHNLQISGGGEKHLYNIAANYSEAQEDFKKARNNRMIIDMRNDWNFNRWLHLSVNVYVNYANSKTPMLNPKYGGNLFGFGEWRQFTPYTSFTDGIVEYRRDEYGNISSLKSWDYDLLDNLGKETYSTKDLQTRVNATLRINIMDGLTADLGGNWQRGNYVRKGLREEDSFYARLLYNNGTSIIDETQHVIPEGGVLDETRNSNEFWTGRAQLNYNKDFSGGRHRITALAGFEIRRMKYDNNTLPTRVGYNSTAGTFSSMDLYGWNANKYAGQLVQVYGVFDPFVLTEGSLAYMDNRFVSYYGNGSYEYNNKYIVSGSVRLDLTNFFGTDKKYRYKPLWSVGGTWKLSEENFFDVGFINQLNIRGSYGVNGNIALDQGPFLILNTRTYNSDMGGMEYRIASPPNDQLRWEKTTSVNGGLDMAFFSGRLRLSVDYYYKNSTDLLAPDNIDPTTGYTTLTINAGRIVNKGLEISASGDILKNSPLGWTSTYVFSHNRNTVKTYNVSRPSADYYYSTTGIAVEGYALNGLWGPRFSRLDDNSQALIWNSKGEEVLMSNIAVEDLVYLGQRTPKFDMSFSNRFTLGDWDLSFMLVAKLGHKHYGDIYRYNNYNNRNIVNAWKGPGDDTIYPYISYMGNVSNRIIQYSDVLIKSSNFMRLREINLGYNLNRNFLNKIKLKSARVYIQGRNLLLVTAKGVDIDPEAGYTGFSLPKEFHVGLQVTF